MTITTSVYDKALHLAAEARRLQAGQQSEQEAQHAAHQIEQIKAELGTLADLVAVAASLALAGAEGVRLSGLDDGRAAFAAKAAAGLPAEAAFKAARQKLKTVSARISQEVGLAWTDWSSAELATLPLRRIPLLATSQQKAARQSKADLEKLAKAPKVSTSAITLFRTGLETLREFLDQVADPTPELVTLLDKIDGPPVASLRDITDEEIALLRQHGQDGQITLRRLGA
ncbi:hypothetical protein [Catenulispora pinisilvae]|uniref:hypothetical protein n=1 Tax=Catenulispora pinisilvae TaxID=2705253 RepID=UPI0018919C9E|nr:hypothetical protein [Catenulispora pinisilvae]